MLEIEVKTKDKRKGLKKVIAECFEQCERAIKFVAYSTLDIMAEKKFGFLR